MPELSILKPSKNGIWQPQFWISWIYIINQQTNNKRFNERGNAGWCRSTSNLAKKPTDNIQIKGSLASKQNKMNFDLLNLYALTTSPADIWFVVSFFSYSLLIAHHLHIHEKLYHVHTYNKSLFFWYRFQQQIWSNLINQKKNFHFIVFDTVHFLIFPLCSLALFSSVLELRKIVQQIAS